MNFISKLKLKLMKSKEKVSINHYKEFQQFVNKVGLSKITEFVQKYVDEN